MSSVATIDLTCHDMGHKLFYADIANCFVQAPTTPWGDTDSTALFDLIIQKFQITDHKTDLKDSIRDVLSDSSRPLPLTQERCLTLFMFTFRTLCRNLFVSTPEHRGANHYRNIWDTYQEILENLNKASKIF